MSDKESKIDCKSLMVNTSTGTGYWFCKENGSMRVDEDYCKNCLLNKELAVEICPEQKRLPEGNKN